MNEWREKLTAYWKQLLERWNAQSMRNKTIAVVAASALVGVGVLVAATQGNSSTDKKVLYAGLSPQDATQVADRLRAMNVPFEQTEGGSTLLVPEEQVENVRNTLSREGLPSDSVGFELFDKQNFGVTENEENVNYQRAMQGELERTIEHISGVKSARVHLVMPERSLFASDSDHNATATVFLELQAGWRLEQDRVRGIRHLVASSVRSLKPENVTITDSTGRRLDEDTEQTDQTAATDALNFQRRIEKQKEDALQALLDNTLGRGKAFVRVAADVNFSREERTSRQFDPNTTAVRSFERATERDANSTGTTQGVPGAASNLPGGEAAQTSNQQQGVIRESLRENHEVSEVTTKVIEPIGRVKRLTVSVVVDGNWSGPFGKRKFSRRSQEDLNRIKSIVENAVAVDRTRGDSVTVECEQFESSLNAEEPPIKDPLVRYRPFFPYAGMGFGALATLAAALYVQRRMKKARLEREAREAEAKAKAAAEAEEAARKNSEEHILGVKQLEAGQKKQNEIRALAEKAQRDEDVARIQLLASEVASKDPQAAARVLHSWIVEG